MIEEDIPDIVETLRECAEDSRKVEGDYYADQFATDASVFDDAADAIEKLRDEIARLRLTSSERGAVADAADRYAAITPESSETAATLRGLISRTGQNLRQTCDNEAKCHSQSEKNPERDRLTAEEREAVEQAAEHARQDAIHGAAATLRGLLERTK